MSIAIYEAGDELLEGYCEVCGILHPFDVKVTCPRFDETPWSDGTGVFVKPCIDACECMYCQNDDSDDMAMYESDDSIPF